ncbi:MAG: hypothetical protein HYR76_08710 [Ignavibacteria bacterium]|nr:hypothetical protein [Ignavibacteria bacterium]
MVGVERVIIKYYVQDYLNIEIGRHHTPIGYWNTAYHHGFVLQPTISRPLLFAFDEAGGFLPIHTVGLLLSGSNITELNIGYSFMIGDGIGSTSISENDNAKSYTLRLNTAPITGLDVGASGYLDYISSGVKNLRDQPLTSQVKQQLISGYMVYLRRPYELMGEYLYGANSTDSVGIKHTKASYVHAGYRFENFIPYARYEQVNFEDGDPYFNPNNVKLFLAGLRYEFSSLSVLKLEYRNVKTSSDGTRNEIVFQFAIGF